MEEHFNPSFVFITIHVESITMKVLNIPILFRSKHFILFIIIHTSFTCIYLYMICWMWVLSDEVYKGCIWSKMSKFVKCPHFSEFFVDLSHLFTWCTPLNELGYVLKSLKTSSTSDYLKSIKFTVNCWWYSRYNFLDIHYRQKGINVCYRCIHV